MTDIRHTGLNDDIWSCKKCITTHLTCCLWIKRVIFNNLGNYENIGMQDKQLLI